MLRDLGLQNHYFLNVNSWEVSGKERVQLNSLFLVAFVYTLISEKNIKRGLIRALFSHYCLSEPF
jgi:hypothetical protein